MKKMFALALGTALIFSLAACGGGSGDNGAQSSAAVETSEANATSLHLIASNWKFDQEEYRVKAGEPIDFSIENAEGYHEYEIKGLGINVKPDEPKQFTINEPGEYDIICSFMCGAGHSDMVAKLIVE